MRRRLVTCDWCEDSLADLLTAEGLPEGWSYVTASQEAPRKLAGLGAWDLCPDCTLARAKVIGALNAHAADAWGEAIAGQLAPILQGRGHTKLVLKGRDG